MNTTTQKQLNRISGLKSRPEQVSTEKGMSEREAQARIELIETRRANRELPKEVVLNFLQSQLPKQFEMAEIVGKWIWLDFPKEKHRAAAKTLYRLGFHWNQRRCIWQHPCGAFAPYSPNPGDPRQK